MFLRNAKWGKIGNSYTTKHMKNRNLALLQKSGLLCMFLFYSLSHLFSNSIIFNAIFSANLHKGCVTVVRCAFIKHSNSVNSENWPVTRIYSMESQFTPHKQHLIGYGRWWNLYLLSIHSSMFSIKPDSWIRTIIRFIHSKLNISVVISGVQRRIPLLFLSVCQYIFLLSVLRP